MSTGLRRFARPEPAPDTESARAAERVERCELCGEPSGPEGTVFTPAGHGHVVNLETRSLMCSCRPCYLLFTNKGAAGGRYRAVPERYLHDPNFALTPVQWEEMQVPVRMAFFFFNSRQEEWVAFYPSPAGATESLLSLESWVEVVAANPEIGAAEPDVEGVLLQRTEEGFEGFLVPITACYELVARVRMKWQGFDGGEEAHAEIAQFFQALRDRSERVR